MHYMFVSVHLFLWICVCKVFFHLQAVTCVWTSVFSLATPLPIHGLSHHLEISKVPGPLKPITDWWLSHVEPPKKWLMIGDHHPISVENKKYFRNIIPSPVMKYPTKNALGLAPDVVIWGFKRFALLWSGDRSFRNWKSCGDNPKNCGDRVFNMGVFINRGTQKWLVYMGKPY